MSGLTLAAACLLLTPVQSPAAEPLTRNLWPGVAPGEKGNIPPEKFEAPRAKENPPIQRLMNVSQPTITVYRPKPELNNGTAVVVAPGGGYTILAWEHEGTMVAEWLNRIGVTAVLLKYRVPRRPDQPKDAPPLGALQDAQRAIRLTRQNAQAWKIDPQRIGMLGFSAGGHLTAWTCASSEQASYEAVDEADRLSARPDFAVMIYPGGLLDREKKVRSEIKVSEKTPHSFLVVSFDDEGSFASTMEYVRLLKEKKISTEFHLYRNGGHGYGMKKTDQPYGAWPDRCAEWMKSQGWLKQATPKS